MLALPPAAPPAPRRQLLIGTAVACVAVGALVGGLLALWMRMRTATMDANASWIPKGIKIPMVPANTMLLAFIPICVMAQWAVYASRRDARSHTALALAVVAVIGLAVINAQAYIYAQMKLPAASKSGGAFNAMFYGLTGTFIALVALGVGFSIVTAFRYLGGRTSDREIVAAHALYWYFLAAVCCALWFVVYVTK